MKLKPQDTEPETDESEPDSDFDGGRGPRVPRGVVVGATTTVVAPNPHPANVAPPHVDEKMNSMDNVPNPEDDLEVGEIGPTMVVTPYSLYWEIIHLPK